MVKEQKNKCITYLFR